MEERGEGHTADSQPSLEAAATDESTSLWVWGTWRQVGLITLGLAVWAFAYVIGLTYNLLVLTLWSGPLVLFVSRQRHKKQGELAPPLWRRRSPIHVLQFVNFALFWTLVGVAMAPAPINIQFSPAGHVYAVVSLCAGAAVLAGSGAVPRRRASVAINLVAIVGSLWFALQLGRVHMTLSNAVKLSVPLEGQWYVLHGGPSLLYNHHYSTPAQRHALDLAAVQETTQDVDTEGLEGFLAYGATVRSPATGRVATVIGNLPDQPLGSADPNNPAGNYVTIDMGEGRFVLLAHLREGSVAVKTGDPVEPGDLIGEVGNSGNTSEPHLHIQIQDAPTFEEASRTWPLSFPRVLRAGADLLSETHAVPRRDDRLSAEESRGAPAAED